MKLKASGVIEPDFKIKESKKKSKNPNENLNENGSETNILATKLEKSLSIGGDSPVKFRGKKNKKSNPLGSKRLSNKKKSSLMKVEKTKKRRATLKTK